jgi:hypothetical protein
MLNEFPMFVNFETQQRMVKSSLTTRQRQLADFVTHRQ